MGPKIEQHRLTTNPDCRLLQLRPDGACCVVLSTPHFEFSEQWFTQEMNAHPHMLASAEAIILMCSRALYCNLIPVLATEGGFLC